MRKIYRYVCVPAPPGVFLPVQGELFLAVRQLTLQLSLLLSSLQQGQRLESKRSSRSDTSSRPTTMPSQETSPVSTPRTPASTPRADRSPPLPLRQPRARPGTLESEEIYNPDMMRLLLSEDCLESDGKENTPPFILRAARRHERLTPRRLSDALQDSNPSTRQM